MPKTDEELEAEYLKSFILDEEQEPDISNIPNRAELQRDDLYTNKTLGEIAQLNERLAPASGKPDDKKGEEDEDEDEEEEEKNKETPDDKGDEEDADDGKKKEGEADGDEEEEEQPQEKPKPVKFESHFDEHISREKETESKSDERIDALGELTDEEQETIDFWRFAEEASPDVYDGRVDDAISFIKRHRELVARLKKEDPDTPLGENEDYVSWMNENRPTITTKEKRRLDAVREERRERAIETRVRTKLEQEQQQKEIVSKIEATAKRFGESMTTQLKSLGGDSETVEEIVSLVGRIKEGDDPSAVARELLENFPGQGEEVLRHVDMAQSLGKRWLEYRSGMRSLKADDQIDKVLISKVLSYERALLDDNTKEGRARRTRNGKTLASLIDYAGMKPDEQAKHWVLTNDQVLNAISIDAMNALVDKLNEIDKIHLKRFGKTSAQALRAERLALKEGKKPVKEEPKKEEEEEEEIPASPPPKAADSGTPPPKKDDVVSDFISGI